MRTAFSSTNRGLVAVALDRTSTGICDPRRTRTAVRRAREQPPPRRFVRRAVHVGGAHPFRVRRVERRVDCVAGPQQRVADHHGEVSRRVTGRRDHAHALRPTSRSSLIRSSRSVSEQRVQRQERGLAGLVGKLARRIGCPVVGLTPVDHVSRVGERGLPPGAEQATDVIGVPVRDHDDPDIPRANTERCEFLVQVPCVEIARRSRRPPRRRGSSPSGASISRRGEAAVQLALVIQVRAARRAPGCRRRSRGTRTSARRLGHRRPAHGRRSRPRRTPRTCRPSMQKGRPDGRPFDAETGRSLTAAA